MNGHSEGTEAVAPPSGATMLACALQQRKPILERRIQYRHALTAAVDKPPPGARQLNRVAPPSKSAPSSPSSTPAFQPLVAAETDPTKPPEGSELCSDESIDHLMTWKTIKGVDCGLVNNSVTCYMNSTLQCLTFTAPLANYLAKYRSSHKGPGVDWLEALQRVTNNALTPPRRKCTMNPLVFVQNLRRLSSSFRRGRMEDAESFATSLLDALQTFQLSKYGDQKDRLVQETTPIRRIFGGFLRSTVAWSTEAEEKALALLAKKKKGKGSPRITPSAVQSTPVSVSNTYEPFTILGLEVSGSSLEKCFLSFTRKEKLDNLYRTPSGAHVPATKQMQIFRRPRILIISLKRFSFSMWGSKMSKKISYPEILDITAYCAKPSGDCRYQLYGVLVHLGRSLNSGHYIAYVRGPNGLWYLTDDESVHQVGLEEVLKQEAYMLFYQQIVPQRPSGAEKGAAKEAKENEAKEEGPVMNGAMSNRQARKEARRVGAAVPDEKEEASQGEEEKVPPRREVVVVDLPKAANKGSYTTAPARKREASPTRKEEVNGRGGDSEVPLANGNGNGHLEPPAKKRRLKKAVKRQQYESQRLNAEDGFNIPEDNEAYWKEQQEIEAEREAAREAVQSDDDAIAATERVAPLDANGTHEDAPPADEGTALQQETAKRKKVVRKVNAAKKRRARDSDTEGSEDIELRKEEARQDVASFKALAALKAAGEAKGHVSGGVGTWEGVDATELTKLSRKLDGPNAGSALMRDEWNRQIDVGRTKKVKKLKAQPKPKMSFQEASEKKMKERQEEERLRLTEDQPVNGEAKPLTSRALKKKAMRKVMDQTFA